MQTGNPLNVRVHLHRLYKTRTLCKLCHGVRQRQRQMQIPTEMYTGHATHARSIANTTSIGGKLRTRLAKNAAGRCEFWGVELCTPSVVRRKTLPIYVAHGPGAGFRPTLRASDVLHKCKTVSRVARSYRRLAHSAAIAKVFFVVSSLNGIAKNAAKSTALQSRRGR